MLAAAKAAREQQTAFEGVQDALRYSGNQVVDILDRMGQKGANFGQIMQDVLHNLSRQMLSAAITGEGAFAKLFGVAGTNGGVGGLFGAIGSMFSGSPVAGATMSSGLGAGTGGLSFPMFAGGTDSAPGGLAWVGERGPELVNLPMGAQVIPNEIATRALNDIPRFADGGVMGGGSPPSLIAGNQTTIAPTFHVTVQGQPGASANDHAKMGETIAKAAEQSMRSMIAQELRTQSKPGGILRK